MKNPRKEQTLWQSTIPIRCGKRGFTLTELLVVTGIIAVLAALSLPVMNRFRDAAHAATCMSNLRQVGSSLLMYAHDNHQKLPSLQSEPSRETGRRGPIWPVQLARAGYMWDGQGTLPCGTGAWTCPKCDYMADTYGGYGVAEDSVIVYGERRPVGVREPGSLRLNRIARPENTWLVGDAAKHPDTPDQGWYAIWAMPDRWSGGHAPAERHGGKVHVCMADGHVQALTREEIRERRITYAVVD